MNFSLLLAVILCSRSRGKEDYHLKVVKKDEKCHKCLVASTAPTTVTDRDD